MLKYIHISSQNTKENIPKKEASEDTNKIVSSSPRTENQNFINDKLTNDSNKLIAPNNNSNADELSNEKLKKAQAFYMTVRRKKNSQYN